MTKQRATPTRGKKHASGDDDSPPSLPTTAASSAPSSAVLAYQRAQDGEHIVTLVVDFLLHAVDATIDETLKANNTFEYTSLKLVNGLIYMMSMVTIDLSTKFKDNPATYEAGDTPAPCPPDIWSKQCIKAKKKPKSHLLRGHSHNNPYGLGSLDEDGEGSEYRSAYQGSPSSKQMRGRSMEKSSQQLGSIVLDTEVTMSIRDLAFRTVSPSDMPLSPDDLQRRQHIEQLLEERVRDEKLRMQADAKRSRTVVRLVIEPVDSDTKPMRKGIVGDGGGASPDMGASPVRDGVLDGLGNERGASEVILVEGADMIVGEDSHLVSRRSKRDMFKHIPQAVFEPTVVLPPTSARIDVAVASARPTNNSRSSSRWSNRTKTPKTPGGSKTARSRAYFTALLATDEPFYIGNGDLEGGPCFGDDSSPAKGVVITQGLVVKSGESFWEGRQQHNPNGGVHTFPRSVSEPAFDATQHTPSRVQPHRRSSVQKKLPPGNSSIVPEESSIDDPATTLPPAQWPPQVLSVDHHIDHHRHTSSKSVSLRIRTPACRKRRSRKVIDDIVLDPHDQPHMPPMAEDSPDVKNHISSMSSSYSQPSVSQRRPSTNSATTVTPQKLVRSPIKHIQLPRVGARTPLGGGGQIVYHSAASVLTLPFLKQQPALS